MREAPLSEPELIVLYDIDSLMEIEAAVAAGAGWRPDFQAKVDRVSVALFGITAADTIRPEPVRSPGNPDRGFQADWERWAAWDAAFAALSKDASWDARCDYFDEIGVERFDENDRELRCFDLFARQIIVAVNDMDPRAKLTLDGSGTRSGQSVDDWGAALEADARRHKMGRS